MDCKELQDFIKALWDAGYVRQPGFGIACESFTKLIVADGDIRTVEFSIRERMGDYSKDKGAWMSVAFVAVGSRNLLPLGETTDIGMVENIARSAKRMLTERRPFECERFLVRRGLDSYAKAMSSANGAPARNYYRTSAQSCCDVIDGSK